MNSKARERFPCSLADVPIKIIPLTGTATKTLHLVSNSVDFSPTFLQELDTGYIFVSFTRTTVPLVLQ